jgi:hypothetical protein
VGKNQKNKVLLFHKTNTVVFLLKTHIFDLINYKSKYESKSMKNVKFIFMSFIALAVLSCSEETIRQNDETAVIKSTGSTKKTAAEDCSTPTLIGPADTSYNCFGLAFSLSETEEKKTMDNAEIYQAYIATGIFKEDNSNKATKVLYWNNLTDYQTGNYTAIDHAAIITDSGNTTVYSKQGLNALYKNCIGYYYLNTTKSYYRTYSLNVDLNKPATAPIRGEVFSVSLQHDAHSLGVQYSWVYDTDNLQLISNDGITLTLKVKDNAVAKSYSITLNAKHQAGVVLNGLSFPKTVTSSYSFVLASNTPPALTASFTGSNYVTQSSVGSWTATISGGALPYQHFSWWIKRHQDPNSFYTQIATGNPIHLYTTTSSKPTYFDLYFRVVDANNQIFITAPQLIQSTGPLELIDL